MNPFEIIKAQLSQSVPFATHTGVEILEIRQDEASARLAQTETTINHIKSQHAGALFTLGEAASGAALAGALAPVIMTVRPVAAEARIAYKKIAKGTIKATAHPSKPADQLIATLDADGKVAFDVNVTLEDEAGLEVADMTIKWHAKKV